MPADRVPHCMWSIAIEPDAEPIVERELTKRVAASRLASVRLDRTQDAEKGGWGDYDRPFEPELQLEDFSHSALVLVCKEFSVQNHLLVRSFMTASADRAGTDNAAQFAQQQWTGSGYVSGERLRAAFTIEDGGISAVMKVLQMHPAFHPREYIDVRFELLGEDRGRITIFDCAAFDEADGASWFSLLGPRSSPALDAMAQAVDPHARCVAVTPTRSARWAWDVVIDRNAGPAAIPDPVLLARVSGATTFQFSRLHTLRA
jgi:hypothetical protein